MRVILILNPLIIDLKTNTKLAYHAWNLFLIEGNLQKFNFDVSQNPQNLPSFWPPSR